MSSRRLTLIAAAVLLAVPSLAHAQTFDVETATRAYLNTLQGAARAKSDAYFEGGYWLILWGALVSVLVDGLLLGFRITAKFRDIAERRFTEVKAEVAGIAGDDTPPHERLRAIILAIFGRIGRLKAMLRAAEGSALRSGKVGRRAIRQELPAAELLYFADSVDAERHDPDEERPLAELDGSLTWHVLRSGRPLRGSRGELQAKVGMPLRAIGTDSLDWLGVPMLQGDLVRGAIVVQSYVLRERYSAADEALLAFVASHILTALDRKQSVAALEARVEERTSKLRHEVEVRQRAEHLQAALYRLADLTLAPGPLDTYLAAAHDIIGSLNRVDPGLARVAAHDDPAAGRHDRYQRAHPGREPLVAEQPCRRQVSGEGGVASDHRPSYRRVAGARNAPCRESHRSNRAPNSMQA